LITIQLHTGEIADIYARFARIVGVAHWKKRVAKCKEAIKGNEFLREYLLEENAIAFQLAHLDDIVTRHCGITAEALRPVYPAAAFAAQVLSLMDASPQQETDRLCARVRGAFKNPPDMRGLRLELVAATHFLRRGKRISWPEMKGAGTFDLLVEGGDAPPLEVECKSIADDKGHKIHQREVRDFAALLKPYVRPILKGLKSGLSVTLTMPERFPTDHRARVALAKSLGSAVFRGSDCTLPDGASVQIKDFETTRLGTDLQEIRATVDRVTETSNRHAVITWNPRGGVLALAIQSARDDPLLRAIFDTLKDAAERQLTGTRAAALFAAFEGIDGDQLLSIAQQDQDGQQRPTALRVAVSKFLSSESRDHVVGVSFLSRTGFEPAQGGQAVSSGGIAYWFPKPESRYWAEAFSGMFEGMV
jgi:hypothetical protein